MPLGFLALNFYNPAIQPTFEFTSKVTQIEMGTARPLEVRVTEPTKPGTYPVLLWSHGMYGSATGYGPLVESVAGNGYIVVQMTHADSLKYMSREDRQKLARNFNANNTSNWQERPSEVSLCIDSLGTLVSSNKGIKPDYDKIAIGGHSYGAWTTQVLAGMELAVGGRTFQAAEPRAKAFIVVSPNGGGPSVGADQLAKMTGPMLMITGSLDTSPRGETPEWRRKAFDFASPGDKTFVWIEGADHGFGGISGTIQSPIADRFLAQVGFNKPKNADHLQTVQSAIGAFLDRTLRQSPSAKSYLSPSGLGSIAGVSIETK